MPNFFAIRPAAEKIFGAQTKPASTIRICSPRLANNSRVICRDGIPTPGHKKAPDFFRSLSAVWSRPLHEMTEAANLTPEERAAFLKALKHYGLDEATFWFDFQCTLIRHAKNDDKLILPIQLETRDRK